MIPRRNKVYEWTPAERAIQDAVDVVERAGAHPLLTDAVTLLAEARAKVADFVDGPDDPMTRLRSQEPRLLLRSLWTERYWCGCRRESRWDRCERHGHLELDEEPLTQAEEARRAAPAPVPAAPAPCETCGKCGQPKNHPHHDADRWPGRISTNHPYHGFVPRNEMTLDDLTSYRPPAAPAPWRPLSQRVLPAEVGHATTPVQVWADVDVGIAGMVLYLNSIPGVRTHASCQGTLGGGGAEPYRPYVLASWPAEQAERIAAEFDVDLLGDHHGYLHPRIGVAYSAPAPGATRRATEAGSVSGYGIVECRGHWHVTDATSGDHLIVPGDPFPTREAALDAADELNRDAPEATRETNGCPCTLVEPCRPSCTCANPLLSGGCDRCARYGSLEQRRAKAAALVAGRAALSREIETLTGALSGLSHIADRIDDLAQKPTFAAYRVHLDGLVRTIRRAVALAARAPEPAP